MSFIDDKREQEALDPEKTQLEQAIRDKMEEEARACIRAHNDERVRNRRKKNEDDYDDGDDDEDVEVHYV